MNLSHRVLAVVWAVWVLVSYAWAYLVKWSVTTRTFSSRPFPGYRHSKLRWTSSKGCVARTFSRGALGCLPMKARHGWHFQIWSFTWAAMWGQKNWSCMRSSMGSRPRWPTSSWHSFRATSLCVVGKTNWKRVSSDSKGLAHLYRMPCLSKRWFCSHRNWLNSGGSINLDSHYPSVPQSHSLEMTRLRVGSSCWAWCQSSKVIQVTCCLSWTASRTCRSQL